MGTGINFYSQRLCSRAGNCSTRPESDPLPSLIPVLFRTAVSSPSAVCSQHRRHLRIFSQRHRRLFQLPLQYWIPAAPLHRLHEGLNRALGAIGQNRARQDRRVLKLPGFVAQRSAEEVGYHGRDDGFHTPTIRPSYLHCLHCGTQSSAGQALQAAQIATAEPACMVAQISTGAVQCWAMARVRIGSEIGDAGTRGESSFAEPENGGNHLRPL
jgi:hypothetical protein